MAEPGQQPKGLLLEAILNPASPAAESLTSGEVPCALPGTKPALRKCQWCPVPTSPSSSLWRDEPNHRNTDFNKIVSNFEKSDPNSTSYFLSHAYTRNKKSSM